MAGIAKDSTLRRAHRWPDSEVLYDYDFLDVPDLHGYEQLYSGKYEPPIGWDRKGMWVGVDNRPSAIGTAIKRVTHWDRYNRLLMEGWVSLAQHYGDNNIRGVEIGFDQADNAGNRNYFALRRVFTKTSGVATARWDLKTGSETTPAYIPLPNQGVPVTPIGGSDTEPDPTGSAFPLWPTNENKRNTMYMALEVDPVTNKYLGIQVNDYKLGTLRDSDLPDPTLSAITGMSSTLVRFANGLNTSFDLRGLVSGSRTAADLYVERVRVSGRKTA